MWITYGLQTSTYVSACSVISDQPQVVFPSSSIALLKEGDRQKKHQQLVEGHALVSIFFPSCTLTFEIFSLKLLNLCGLFTSHKQIS